MLEDVSPAQMTTIHPAHKYPSEADYAALRRPLGRVGAYASLMVADHGIFRHFYNRPTRLSDEMWRSCQPSPAGLRRMRDKGVCTIVNLRGPSPKPFYALEAEACRKLGLNLVDFRMRSRDVPSRQHFHDIRGVFETIAYPALVHCKSGADRAGLMSALYCMMRLGQPVELALDQLSLRYGHFRQAKTGILDFVLEAYRDANRREPVDFMDWVDHIYDPAALKAKFLAGFWPSLLVDRILHRE